MSWMDSYRQVGYLQSSGTQYINTLVNATTTIDIEIKADVLKSTSDKVIIGSWNNKKGILIGYNSGYAFAFASNWSGNTGTYNTGFHVLKKVGTNGYFDGTLVYTSSQTEYLYPLYIFKAYSFANASTSRVAYCKIFDNNILVRNYIAVKRTSDSVLGLYDTANDVFYTNAGSGTFTAGEDWYRIQPVSSSGGSTNLVDNYYEPATALTITATPDSKHVFGYFKITTGGTTTTSTSNPLALTATADTTVEPIFNNKYGITIDYDRNLGSASFSYGSNAGQINLVASPYSNGQFLGWYVNSNKISSSTSATYYVSNDTIFEARFERVWNVTASSAGNGQIDYIRQTTDKNIVTFTNIADEHYHFVKYTLVNYAEKAEIKNLVTANDKFIITQDGKNITATVIYNVDEDRTEARLTIDLNKDLVIIAYFEVDPRYRINVESNIKHATIYQSAEEVWKGDSATIFARPFPNYVFSKWSDGNTENPRTFYDIQNNIYLTAQYSHVSDTNGIYQYRCYIKDQLYLTDPPKAFMIAENFSINEDKLTNATSQITVLNLNGNINNGDILVLYDPTGTTIYQGVITSIETETYEYTIVNEDFKKATINCSQMQSFFKGTWIYNIHASDYLETEIAYLVGEYAQGKLYGSTYTDPLVAQRLGGFTIESVGSTQANLPSDTDSDGTENYTEYDMEEWIYSLYQKYEIDFQFEVNFSGKNFLRIKVPTYESLKVGNNIYAITDMKPIEEIEETNKLVIFNQDKTYKTTYIATKTETLENPTSTANRFNITNTKIVYMNDEDNISDIVANNLPSTMYNHKLTFTLILKNFVYKFTDFHLAMPLEVWHNNDYYSTVLTGWAINKNTNENITQIELVCGLVRKKLTQLLTLKKV